MEEKNIQLSGGNLLEALSKLPEEKLQIIVNQSNNWNGLVSSNQIVNGVIRNMKEVAVLPSEVPRDSTPITRVEYPKDGGVLTYMGDLEHPYRGFPTGELVERIDFIKKTSRSFLSGLYHSLKKRNKLWFITLAPSLWLAKDIFRAIIYTDFRIIERIRIKKEMYCLFVREIYRVFSIEFPKENLQDSEFRKSFRDVLCMHLEMDNAYRFRVQDILVELDKIKLKKNTEGELLRLLSLMQEREKVQQVSDTWTLVKYGVKYYLLFDRKVKRMLVNALSQLDLDKVSLTVEDKTFCIPRKDYTFGFIKEPNMEDSRLIHLHKLRERFNEEQGKIKQESTKEHEEIQDKHFKENQKVLAHNEGNRELIEALKKRQFQEMIELDNKFNLLLKDADERYAQAKAKIN